MVLNSDVAGLLENDAALRERMSELEGELEAERMQDGCKRHRELAASLQARVQQLEGALKAIRDMKQDDLKGKLKQGDTFKIIGALSRLFNDCRDIASAALHTPEVKP
jgi:predicted nuclease with TOPRIM domain